MKSKIAIITLALIASATVSATEYSTASTLTGGAKVSGYMANNVSATAQVNGLNGGSSVSGAGSSGFTNATASISADHDVTVNWTGNKQSIDAKVTGTTDTKVNGFAYNTSTPGTGATGSASSNGWADAGSIANIRGTLGNTVDGGSINVGGQIDTGHPTNVGRGPDVAMSVNTNQGAAAGGIAGGAFDATGHVDINDNFTKGTITGAVGDVKNATAYAAISPGIGSIGGFTGQMVNPSVLNAGSSAVANVDGKFSLTNGTVSANGTIVNGSIGDFTGPVAPSTPVIAK
jgi:hypothetical protein